MQFSYELSTKKLWTDELHVFNLFQHFTVLILVFNICLILMLNITKTNDIVTGVIAFHNDFQK